MTKWQLVPSPLLSNLQKRSASQTSCFCTPPWASPCWCLSSSAYPKPKGARWRRSPKSWPRSKPRPQLNPGPHFFCPPPGWCLNVFFFFLWFYTGNPSRCDSLGRGRLLVAPSRAWWTTSAAAHPKKIQQVFIDRRQLSSSVRTNDLKDSVLQDSESGEWKFRNDTIQVLGRFQGIYMEKNTSM